jgi:hypothetical protein
VTGPGGSPGLERGYRRLLACYPAQHRRAHEQEMLDVLMAGARHGQRRPRLAESADLIRGAVRIRTAPAPAGTAGVAWRDALAVVSVVWPLYVLVQSIASTALSLTQTHGGFTLAGAAIGSAYQLPIVVLVLLRLRRTAALLTAVVAVFEAGAAIIKADWAPGLALLLVTYGLEAVALAASPGPRRGLQLLGRRQVLALITAGVASPLVLTGLQAHSLAEQAAAIGAIAVVAAALALASGTGRRILALLAIPAYSYAVFLAVGLAPPTPAEIAVTFLPPLLIGALIATSIGRSRRQAGHAAAGTPGPPAS